MGVCVGSDLKGQGRKHFVVVPLDGDFRVGDMAPSIQALKKAAADSNGAVGVGVVSMMGFEHTRNELAVSVSFTDHGKERKRDSFCENCRGRLGKAHKQWQKMLAACCACLVHHALELHRSWEMKKQRDETSWWSNWDHPGGRGGGWELLFWVQA